MSTLTSTTSTTRPTLGAGDVGNSYFETDSNKILVWDGSAWNEWNNDSVVVPGFNNDLSAKFDGTDDQINCGSSTGLDFGSGGFTINCWVRQLDTGVNVLIERAGAFQISLNGGVFYYYGYNSDGPSNNGFLSFSSGLGTTNWYMLTITHEGGSNSTADVKGYIDGSLITTYTGNNYTSTSSGNWIMGKVATSTQYSLNGYMDEVGVWTRVLSASEISNIYNLGTPNDIGNSNNLLAWWRMGDGSGDTNSASGTPANGDTIGTVKNVANPGTHDGTGSGVLYSSVTP